MSLQTNPSFTVSFRPVCDDDEDFLFTLFASTRLDELNLALWEGAEREKFLRMQFTAQQRHYRDYYADARFEIILLGDQPVGRIYVHRRDDEIRLVDISLLPKHRGFGIGGSIISNLLAEAASTGRPVRLHVQCNNPALRLYHRLGFRLVSNSGVCLLMEWLSP